MSRKKKKNNTQGARSKDHSYKYGDADLTNFINELDGKRTGKPLQLVAQIQDQQQAFFKKSSKFQALDLPKVSIDEPTWYYN